MRRRSHASRALALLLCASTSSASPGDITRAAAPVIGADPPARVQIASGDAKVSPQTGALQLGYSFTLPPGRAGMTPSLGLSYSSQAALRGDVAAGWSLGVPRIERVDAGALSGEERWISTLAGSRELVEVSELASADVSDTFRAQGDDSYTRYQKMQPWFEGYRWRVLTTDGTHHEFGGGPVRLAGHLPLTRSIDVHGNEIDYVWEKVMWGGKDADLRLRYIRYGKGLPAGFADHFAEIELQYENAPTCGAAPVGAQMTVDPIGTQYRGATKLVGVITRVRPTPTASLVGVRRWKLGYNVDAERCDQQHSPLRILSSVWELEVQSGIALRPPTTFTYGDLDRNVSGTLSLAFPAAVVDPHHRFGHGVRIQGNGKWSTLESQMLDLDGDARPDRVMDVTADGAERCEIGWDRNAVGTTDVAFTDSPLTTQVPPIPWKNASPIAPTLNPGTMGAGEVCSLTGQLSFFIDPSITEQPECAGEPVMHLGHFQAYRYLDIDADGLNDLVTALHYDPLYWPNPPMPPAPPVPQDRTPPCAVLDATCVNDAADCVSNGGHQTCTIDWPALDSCVDNAPREACVDSALGLGQLYMRPAPLDSGYHNWDELPEGDPWDPTTPEHCAAFQEPLGTDFHYPWTIYRGLGDGRFDVDHPRILYSPIPLQPHTEEPVASNGGVSSNTFQSLIDLDGDGYLDAIHRTKKECQTPPCDTVVDFWQVWRGAPDGRFVGPTGNSDSFYQWKVPASAYPGGANTTDTLDGGKETREVWSLRDVNADGRPDLIQFGGFVYWNLGRNAAGKGEFSDQAVAILPDQRANAYTDALSIQQPAHVWGTHMTMRSANDLDGDGVLDVIDDGRFVRWGTAGVLTPSVIVNAASMITEIARVDGFFEGGDWYAQQTAIDLDGDGLLDGADTTQPTARTEARDGSHRALLASVDNGRGLVTSVKYAAAAWETAVTRQHGRLPRPTWVVTSIDTVDAHMAATLPERTTYGYVGPVWNRDWRGTWGFRGFDETQASGPSGAVTVSRFGYDIDRSGREIKTETYASEADRVAGKPASMTETMWLDFHLFGNALITFHPTKTYAWTCKLDDTVTSCRNSGSVLRTVATWAGVTPTNVPYPVLFAKTQDQSLDQMGAVNEGELRTRASAKIAYSATSTILRPFHDYTDEHLAGAWTLVAHTRHYFDANLENELRTEVWQNASVSASTERTYDGGGNVLTMKKPKQYAAGSTNVTTYAYDAWKLHVARTTNEIGHVVETDHDAGTGAITATRGPNTKTVGTSTVWEGSKTVYDFLGRPVETWVSIDHANQGYKSQLVGRTTYADFASPAKVTTERRIAYGGAEWVTVDTLSDGHGRPFRETTRTFDATLPDGVTSRRYDHRGHMVSFTAPDPSKVDGGTGVTTTYEYDSIGRATALRDARGNGVNLSYDGLIKTQSECAKVGSTCVGASSPSGPEVLATTVTTSDARGRLVKVQERHSEGWAATTYGYDGLGRMSLITNADNLVTRMEHDWTGDRTAIRRAVGTPSERAWTYTYDPNGRMLSEVLPYPSGASAVLYTTTFAYDDLDRETSRLQAPLGNSAATVSELGIGLNTTTYDAGTNGKGRVTHTHTNVVDVDLQYDALGRLTQETRGFDFTPIGLAYTASKTSTHTYNALGLEVDTVHGDGVTGTRTTYDRRGLPKQLQDLTSLAVLASATHGTSGVLTDVNASNKRSTYVYDELGRVVSVSGLKVSGGQATLVSQTYTLGVTGELVHVNSTVAGLGTRAFDLRYDDQHQLLGAADPTNIDAYSATFAYSPAGRILSADVASNSAQVKTRHVDYEYGASSTYPDPEAVKVLRDVGGDVVAKYAYDSLGNVTQRREYAPDLTWTFAYDGDAQRRATAPDLSTETYYYDAGGRRSVTVERNAAGTETRIRFWSGDSELWFTPTTPVTQTHRFTNLALGRPILRVQQTPSTSVTEVVFTTPLGHMLGTASHLGNQATLTSAYQYGPFGEILGQAGETSTHLDRFNGKEHDTFSNLYYYGYRYYDPLSLQWTQADPLYRFAPDIAWDQPRRMGLYTFDLNNPVRYRDPDGREPEPGLESESLLPFVQQGQGLKNDGRLDPLDIGTFTELLSGSEVGMAGFIFSLVQVQDDCGGCTTPLSPAELDRLYPKPPPPPKVGNGSHPRCTSQSDGETTKVSITAGTVETRYPNGWVVVRNFDGSVELTLKDGTKIVKDPKGNHTVNGRRVRLKRSAPKAVETKKTEPEKKLKDGQKPKPQ